MNLPENDFIQHVSDTSAWVAHYRAIETDRPGALFKDPYARILMGDRASGIEALRSEATKWTQWTVIMRTLIIDQMILDLISEGATTILNLGAGLDSRPYRMNLPVDVHWIELDFPQVIEHKRQALANFSPTCKLQSIGLDLSNREMRKALFAEIASHHPKIAILTEGVLPYLTEAQVSELSEDLLEQPEIRYWIGEYISKKSYRYLKDPKRMKFLKNAPFRFYPEDWMGFFEKRGWLLKQARYYTEISEKLGRPTPLPKIFQILGRVLGEKWATQFKQMSGFLLWVRR